MTLTATDGATVHATRQAMRTAWAVYQIWTGAPQQQSQLVFVGLTKLSNVYLLGDANSNMLFVEKYGDAQLAVRITHIGDKVDCINERLRQVRDYLPECNVKGTAKPSTYGQMVRCVQTGERFNSAAMAALHFNISASNMSNHLNGRSGYKTLRGLTFERIT